MVEISSEMWVGGNFFLKKKEEKKNTKQPKTKQFLVFLFQNRKPKK